MTFPLLDETTAPEGARNALAGTKKNFGMIPNLEKVMASAPPRYLKYVEPAFAIWRVPPHQPHSPTSSTIFPTCLFDSNSAWASLAWAKVKRG